MKKNYFCENLKYIRSSLNISQKEIANHLKLNTSSYSNYENGRREPGIDVLIKISDFLNVEIDKLLTENLSNNDKFLKDIQNKISNDINYDEKILVEQIIPNMVELNCSVLGSSSYSEASAIEQVMGKDEILSFNDKYIGNKAKKGGIKTCASKGMASASRVIPADISDKLKEEIEVTSKKAFRALGASGVVRIDYLYDKKSKELYVNELNSIPGSLAFYLWTPLKKEYPELLDDLINISVKRFKKNLKKTKSFESNILSSYNGSKGVKGKIRK